MNRNTEMDSEQCNSATCVSVKAEKKKFKPKDQNKKIKYYILEVLEVFPPIKL